MKNTKISHSEQIINQIKKLLEHVKFKPIHAHFPGLETGTSINMAGLNSTVTIVCIMDIFFLNLQLFF